MTGWRRGTTSSLLLIDEAKRKDPDGAETADGRQRTSCFCACRTRRLWRPWPWRRAPDTRIIDASTAHRTAPGWVYGFPELRPGQREAIAGARACGQPRLPRHGVHLHRRRRWFRLGLLSADADLCCFSLTGYSGGGKKMIAQYEAAEKADEPLQPRPLRPEPRPTSTCRRCRSSAA